MFELELEQFLFDLVKKVGSHSRRYDTSLDCWWDWLWYKKIIRINFFQKKEKKVGRARLTKNWHKILIEETNVEGESKT